MNRIAKFEKVSFNQFKADTIAHLGDKYSDDELKLIYDNIKIPKRSTSGSAGYDFFCPYDIGLSRIFPTTIPTGIRVKIDKGWVLNIYPRSGMGFKYGLYLLNTVGIIDEDYYYSDNEGHIMIKVKHRNGDNSLKLKSGDRFIQGVFTSYGITIDDNVIKVRNGGFGSTGN